MPIGVKRVGSAFGVLLLAASVPWIAVAEVEGVDEADRWVPALSLSAGFLLQDAEASIESGPVLGPSVVPTAQPIRPAARGEALMITPDLGIALELMTPRVAAEWWAPRFFGHAGVSGAFGPKRDIAKEGVIDQLSVTPELVSLVENDVSGQGSRTRVRVDNPLMRAGLGVAFTVDALGGRLRVRTSIEYLREQVEIQGAVRRAVCIIPPRPQETCGARGVNNGGGGLADFRKVDLRRTVTKDFHGIGPGLEFETDVGRIGSIVPAVSIGGQAFRFLGRRKISFSTSNEFGETLRASFEKDPWAYRVGVGIRLRWLPK